MTTPAAVLDALGDGTRRDIVEALAAGPASVGDLAERLPVSRPAVSQHLRVLHDARLVSVTPEGTRRVYALDPHGADALRGYLDRMWETALDRFEAYVDHHTAQPAREQR